MHLTHRIDRQVGVIFLEGKISLEEEIPFKEYLNTLLQDPALKGIVINLEKVHYVSSAGLGLMVAAFKIAESFQKELVICNVGPVVRNLFHVAQLDRYLIFYSNEMEALMKLNGGIHD